MTHRRVLSIGFACCVVSTGCSDFSDVCTLEARPGIRAVVRDSVTGVGLAASAIAVAREGAFVDTLRGADSLMWGVHERAGSYLLEVSHSGYQAWARTGVRVPDGGCHVETARVVVLLVPN